METKPAKTYKFQAAIQPADGGGAYVFFPYDTQQEFATKSKIPIQAIIAGIPYRGSLIPYGMPQHMLHVSKAIRHQSGKDIGDPIEVELWKDDQPRILELPSNFQSLLEQEGLQPFFDSLSYTHRKEYIRWIAEAKTETTQSKRLTKAIEMLKQRVKTPG
jgi:Bacteriocin-protection, YdeI or OmpD-Associated/Domain of unknown function (DUF1905)